MIDLNLNVQFVKNFARLRLPFLFHYFCFWQFKYQIWIKKYVCIMYTWASTAALAGSSWRGRFGSSSPIRVMISRSCCEGRAIMSTEIERPLPPPPPLLPLIAAAAAFSAKQKMHQFLNLSTFFHCFNKFVSLFFLFLFHFIFSNIFYLFSFSFFTSF